MISSWTTVPSARNMPDLFVRKVRTWTGTLTFILKTSKAPTAGVGFEKQLLKHGDKIQIGKHTFVFDSGQGSHEQTSIYLPDT